MFLKFQTIKLQSHQMLTRRYQIFFTAETRRTQRCFFLFFAFDPKKCRRTGRMANNKRALFLKII